jgi:hypothetical protein
MIENPSYWFNNPSVGEYIEKSLSVNLEMAACVAAAAAGVALIYWGTRKGADTIGENLSSEGVRNLDKEENNNLEVKVKPKTTFPSDR